MNAMEIKKGWNTPSGIAVEVTGRLVTSKEVNLDGDIDTVATCDIQIDVKANGQSQGAWVRELSAAQKSKLPKECEFCVGKLPLTAAQAAIIADVETELKQHPLWVAKQATIQKNQREIAAYHKAINSTKGGYADRKTY